MINPTHTLSERVFKNGNTRPGRTWIDYLPVHQLRTEEVFGAIADAGLQPHHAYSLGNQRVSCVFCIMGCRGDLQNGARHNPELYQKYALFERRCGYTFHPSQKTLPELTGIAANGEAALVPERVRRNNTQPGLFSL